ncbi:hypothetical protein R6V09_41070 [Streptomyces sp. W16]|uniref:hypothetical protein n=1 Tax=Streptomyces sp. W16 TaxID=3076631 RepID=UPI00295B9835|nr:hypothetical protein [Streptomyces sp. W16]MDV9176506.1 hypothetical protein [Streptomyces sp. W16]
MDELLAALASSGAATLTGLMLSDAWEQVKEKIVRVIERCHRGGGNPDPLLEESRLRLIAARDEGNLADASDVEREWRLRVAQLMREDATVVQDLIAIAVSMTQSGHRGAHHELRDSTFNGPTAFQFGGTGDQHNTFGV